MMACTMARSKVVSGGRVQLPGSAMKFTGTPSGIYRRPPLLDEHRAEILAEAGFVVAGDTNDGGAT